MSPSVSELKARLDGQRVARVFAADGLGVLAGWCRSSGSPALLAAHAAVVGGAVWDGATPAECGRRWFGRLVELVCSQEPGRNDAPLVAVQALRDTVLAAADPVDSDAVLVGAAALLAAAEGDVLSRGDHLRDLVDGLIALVDERERSAAGAFVPVSVTGEVKVFDVGASDYTDEVA